MEPVVERGPAAAPSRLFPTLLSRITKNTLNQSESGNPTLVVRRCSFAGFIFLVVQSLTPSSASNPSSEVHSPGSSLFNVASKMLSKVGRKGRGRNRLLDKTDLSELYTDCGVAHHERAK